MSKREDEAIGAPSRPVALEWELTNGLKIQVRGKEAEDFIGHILEGGEMPEFVYLPFDKSNTRRVVPGNHIVCWREKWEAIPGREIDVQPKGVKMRCLENANLYEGPGYEYKKVGSVAKGEIVWVISRQGAGAAGVFYCIGGDRWISWAFLEAVNDTGDKRSSIPYTDSRLSTFAEE